MSFGFPAYFAQIVFIPIQQHEFGQVVREVLDNLECNFTEISSEEFHFSFGINALSWGEKMKIKLLADQSLLIESHCVYPFQLFDWGKNKGNVHLVTAKLQFASKRHREFDDHNGIAVGFDDKGLSRVEKIISAEIKEK